MDIKLCLKREINQPFVLPKSNIFSIVQIETP